MTAVEDFKRGAFLTAFVAVEPFTYLTKGRVRARPATADQHGDDHPTHMAAARRLAFGHQHIGAAFIAVERFAIVSPRLKAPRVGSHAAILGSPK